MTLDEVIIFEEKAYERCKQIGFAINSKYNSDTERGRKYYTYAEEHKQLAEWLKDYKKLKEQEPCEDAISRKAVLEMAKSYNTDRWDMYTPLVVDVEDIEELPSVIPQARK